MDAQVASYILYTRFRDGMGWFIMDNEMECTITHLRYGAYGYGMVRMGSSSRIYITFGGRVREGIIYFNLGEGLSHLSYHIF